MIAPIKTKSDYKKAISRIEELWDQDNIESKNELEVLSILIDEYENKNYEILPPDPVEAIKFRMEQYGYKNSDVSDVFGGTNRVSEVLHRKRNLTVKMIRGISKKLNIPAESLIN